MKFRGRHWLAVVAVVFLAVATIVVLRQRSALRTARELDAARGRRSALEAERADAIERIRRAESRGVLSAKARTLGLRFAADSEVVFLTLPEEPAN